MKIGLDGLIDNQLSLGRLGFVLAVLDSARVGTVVGRRTLLSGHCRGRLVFLAGFGWGDGFGRGAIVAQAVFAVLCWA
jgi:hypothetical protein